jgi:hypothetical protein
MHPCESEAIIYLASGDDDPFNKAIAKTIHSFSIDSEKRPG